MTKLASQNIRWKFLIGALVCGIIISLTTGVIENPPEASIIGARYYGHPLVWRVTMTLQPDEFRFTSLAIDTAFWITISLLALVILRKILKKTSPSTEAATAASAAAAAA